MTSTPLIFPVTYLIIGSVADVIVFETAKREGVEIGFFEYMRVGLPLTLLTPGVARAWLA